MQLNELFLWFLADPSKPRYVGALNLVSAGKGVSLHTDPIGWQVVLHSAKICP
jgi:hypothetical protein